MGSERASEGTSPYERVVPLLLMAPSAEASQYPCPDGSAEMPTTGE